MSSIWTCTSVSYFLLGFYIRRLPGDVFYNYYTSAVADTIGILFYASLYKCLKDKWTFYISFLTTILGALLIMLVGFNNPQFMPIFVFLTKIGTQVAFVNSWVAPIAIFPTLFQTTAFGICGFFSNGMTILAPQYAAYDHPFPTILVTVLCIVAMICTKLLPVSVN